MIVTLSFLLPNRIGSLLNDRELLQLTFDRIGFGQLGTILQ